MKYTNKQIVDIMGFLGTMGEKKLPSKISYAIMRNLVIFKREYDVYENALNKLMNDYKEYIVRDDNENPVLFSNGIPKMSDSMVSEFEKELIELLSIEVNISPFYVQESIFEYDDLHSHYDALSASDIFSLIDIMCEKPKDDTNDK